MQLSVEPTAIDGWRDAVWVASAQDGSLRQVAKDGSERGPYQIGGSPSAVVDAWTCAHGDRVWVALSKADAVVEIDGATGAVLRTITVGKGPSALATSAWHDRALWVANERSDSISRIDMSTGTVTETVSVGHGPRSLSVDPREVVYVANHDDATISVVDGRSRVVMDTIPVGQGPSSVAFDFGVPVFDDPPSKVWVANADDDTVMKIDPSTLKILRTWSLAGKPLAVIPIGVRAWVVLSKFGVVRLDDSPKQNLGQKTIRLPLDPIAAVDVDFSAGSDLLWVASASDRTLWRTWS
jgi:YVTN family beta-propeller protein